MSDSDLITESRVIPAAAADIFELLAAPRQHSVIDGSGSVRGVQEGTPERLSPGATFGMQMRIGLPYKITNTVVEFEEGRRIGWRHFAGHVWRYLLEPTGEHTTLVTEQFDPNPTGKPWVYRLMRFDKRNRHGITQTLDRLEHWAEQRREPGR